MSLAASWRRQKPSSRLLRSFLGITFLYAGFQKLSDPGFFRQGGTTYIGSQIQAFANGSPIAPFLRFVGHFPILTGLVVALGEVSIGVAVLLGIGALVASIAGCLISLVLWLSATWHVHPFFLGSDSIYAVAWAAYALRLSENRQAAKAVVQKRHQAPQKMDRRDFLRGGTVAAATLVVGLFARVLSRLAPPSVPSNGLAAATSRTAAKASPSAVASPASTPSPSALKGRVISSLNKLRVGQPVAFVTGNGTPGALFRLSNDKVVAYSRVCTHAGCTVGYDPSAKVLYCPCHGAEFDPAHGASVLAGPAPTPLPRIRVAIDPTTRNVVLPG